MSRFRLNNKEVHTASQTPTITAGLYSAADAVGGLLTFADCAHKDKGSGIIQSVILIDDGDQKAETELHLFNQSISVAADNAAFAVSDADLEFYIGGIAIVAADYEDLGGNAAACIKNINLPFNLASDGTSIFGQLLTRGTPTYASTSDLTVKLVVIRD